MTILGFRRGGWVLSVLILSACTQPQSPTTKPPHQDGHYVAMARGKVDVEGGVLNLPVLRDGVFTTIKVKANDHIHRGQLLAELDGRAALLGVALATAELHHAQAELELLKARLPSVQQTAKRWTEAAQSGVAEQQRADEATLASRQLSAEMSVAQTTVEITQQKRIQAQHEVELQRIVSPINGEVIKVLAQVGSVNSVQEHPVAFQLLPEQPLIIRAEINENYLSQIHIGLLAQVELEAEPEQPAFTARVTRVGRVLEASHLSEESQPTRIIECTLQLEQASPTLVKGLRIGQNVLVKFHE